MPAGLAGPGQAERRNHQPPKDEWTPASWRKYLDHAAEPEAEQIRRYTHTGRPLGSEEFVKGMERQLCRPLTPHKGGRPRKLPVDATQVPFDFALTD